MYLVERLLGGCEEGTYGEGEPTDSLIAGLRTSIAESCPHGYILGTEGPNHRGEYQFVLGERAVFCNVLYFLKASDETRQNELEHKPEY